MTYGLQMDHFLSEEDVDLQTLTMEELVAWWNLWLEQAQITNDLDQDEYSHGVFRHEPGRELNMPRPM